MCRVIKYVKAQRVLQYSEANVDASKKPITAKNTEVTFSVTFFAVMGFCWHPCPPQKRPQSAAFCSRFRGRRGCQQENHHSAEHRGSLLRILNRDGSPAGIHIRLRNGYKCCTLCLELWHVFKVRITLTIIMGCFNSLVNIVHKSEWGLGKDKSPVNS